MMCIDNTPYINTQHRNRCACERKRVPIDQRTMMDGWMDMYRQGIQRITRESMVLQSGCHR